MDKLTAHIRLLRPLNLFIGAFSVIIGVAIAGELHQSATIITATLLVVCFNAGANALNDYFDFEIDKINRPNRPLISGLVQRRTALWLGIFLFAVGAMLALRLNLGAALIAIGAALPLMVLYTPLLKGQPLIGNFAVAFILGLTFIFTGAAVGRPEPLLVPAALAFALTLVRELVKDIADVDGDKKSGLNTLPLLIGVDASIVVAINLAFITVFGTLLPVITGYYGMYYLLVALAGVIGPLFYIIYGFMKSPDCETAVMAARILKVATLLGVIAIYLG